MIFFNLINKISLEKFYSPGWTFNKSLKEKGMKKSNHQKTAPNFKEG